jgi:Gluconate 2-dehydrogenase subunit 3
MYKNARIETMSFFIKAYIKIAYFCNFHSFTVIPKLPLANQIELIMPNRRIAIQQLLMIWAGAALLPSCLQNEQKVSIPLKLIHILPEDENMLADLAETILPKTDSPGARDLSAHLFALKMVDDCYSKINQEKYIEGMKSFETFVRNKTGKSFSGISDADRKSIVADLDKQKSSGDAMSFFYQSTKRLTIQAYTTCEYYMTKIRGYKMIPGKFQGCVPLKTT